MHALVGLCDSLCDAYVLMQRLALVPRPGSMRPTDVDLRVCLSRVRMCVCAGPGRACPGRQRFAEVLGHIDDITVEEVVENLPVIIGLALLIFTFWGLLLYGCYKDRADAAALFAKVRFCLLCAVLRCTCLQCCSAAVSRVHRSPCREQYKDQDHLEHSDNSQLVEALQAHGMTVNLKHTSGRTRAGTGQADEHSGTASTAHPEQFQMSFCHWLRHLIPVVLR